MTTAPLQVPGKSRIVRWARILIAFAAVLLAIPVVAAIWIARGDPDIRLDQHRAYLAATAARPVSGVTNIVLVFADDLGYGDLSCYGSKAIQTPHIDALARSGARFVNFHSASPVCSPSRFSCLTGRYPTRGFIHAVFFPSGTLMGLAVNSLAFPRGVRGIPPDEVTVAEALQAGGYRTGMVGKWHLGDRSPHLPTEKGFDYFFGSYYSNDMKPYAIYRNTDIALEAPVDQTKLTQALTEEALAFIDRAEGGPFFLYYASPFPHHPVHASDRFSGRSRAGSYGDCVEELDWSVGQIQARLAERGLAANTLFVFTSDNGPWYQGSPGPHRGRKANSFNGGQVVPFIAAWPGTIPPETVVDAPAMAIDLFPTFLGMAGIPLPEDRVIDGQDLARLLRGETTAAGDRNLFFVNGADYLGVRSAGHFKYMERRRSENTAYRFARHGPFLFDLNVDRDESYDVSEQFPAVKTELAAAVHAMNRSRFENPRGWLAER